VNGAMIGFWLLAMVSVGTAVGVVVHRSPLRASLLLIVNFICLAFLYLLQNAQVLAFLQVIVYAGAIMVLFLFVIMLLNLGGELAGADPLPGQKLWGLLLAAALLTGMGFALREAANKPSAPGLSLARVQEAERAGVSQIQVIGWDLFVKYVYPFELTSVLLLVGVVGVMLFTKRAGAAGSNGRS